MEDWKKKIKDSAEDTEIPDSLKPENIHVHLNKSRERFAYKPLALTGMAAAAVLLVLAVSQNPGSAAKSSGTMESVAMDTAGMESARADEDGGMKESAVTADDRSEETSAGSAAGATEAGKNREDSISTLPEKNEMYKSSQSIGDFYHTSAYEDIERQIKDAWERQYSNEADRGTGAEDAVMEKSAEEAPQSGESSAASDYSATNLQVEGVDEGDVVKTDGKYLYILEPGNQVSIVKADSLESVSGFSCTQSRGDVSFREMYIDGTRLILVGNSYESRLENSGEDAYCMKPISDTLLLTYDLTDITNPKRVGSVRQDGSYRTSRKVGDYIYLFSDYQVYPGDDAEGNAQMIPRVAEEKIAAGDIYLPKKITRCQYLVMSAVDLKKPGQVTDRKSLMDSGSQFHITKENIYVMQKEWQQNRSYTNVIKFRFKDGKIEGEAAATLRGELTDTFAVNEYKGYLRAVLTERTDRGENNRVYVLDESMMIRGMIDDIAQGEIIYSARFMGNQGYFVTYRNTDPLFSVDFTDPDDPKIIGELKVTGFSEYLHFYGKDKLLGLGWETDPDNGLRQGVKLSMYDISDPKKVKEENKLVLKGIDGCEGLYDYKMVLADPKKNLIGFSVFSSDDTGCHEKYLVFSYDPEKGFKKELEHEMKQGEYVYDISINVRGLYISDRFYVAEEKKITVFDMKNGFEEAASLELPKKR